MSYPGGPYQQYPQYPPTYPPTYPPPPPPHPSSRRPSIFTNQGVLLYIVAPLATVVIVAALVGGVLLKGHQIAFGFLAPRATSTATPDPNAGWRDYLMFVATTIRPLTDDGNQMAKSCANSSDLNPCYTALQTLDDDIHRAQSQLNTRPTPPCLETAMSDLRNSLAELDQAAQEEMSAIQQQSVFLLDAADSHFQQATRDVNSADAEIRAAPCISPTS